MKETLLEICVDTIDAAQSAARGGANRIELCNALSEGGLTPSFGFLREACQLLNIPIFPMIRPRGGDFFYSSDEFEIMKQDIQQAKALGARGVVLGVLKQDSTIDVERTRELVNLARPLQVTFHRAFDLTGDLSQALEDVIATGADILLTSGGHAKITSGVDTAQKLFEQAAGRIEIMIGSGINIGNIRGLAESTDIHTFHASLRSTEESPVSMPKRMVGISDEPASDLVRSVVRENDVREVVRLLKEARVVPATD
jgi:copper homeostasis protein